MTPHSIVEFANEAIGAVKGLALNCGCGGVENGSIVVPADDCAMNGSANGVENEATGH